MEAYYKDKQSGEILTTQEMLDSVDADDQLDSFYLLGEFESKEDATNHFNSLQK